MSTLLVASTGGHLAQLHALWPRIRNHADERVLWVTFNQPQSRSLLQNQQVEYLRYVPPRGAREIALNAARARQILAEFKPSRVISTGSGIALAVMPVARLHGIPCHYIESVARSTGPSMTGKVLRAVPGVRTYCQYPSWASESWPYIGSIFDDFAASTPIRDARPLRVLVTLGTIPYQFDRLVNRLHAIVPESAVVTWQLGASYRPGLRAHRNLSYADLAYECRQADVIVAHAGAGSALMALQQGKAPVLVPRLKERGEHVDDHQRMVADHLADRDLAVVVDADELTGDHLGWAAQQRVSRTTHRPEIRL
ncbi:MAG: glycosyl transferase family 28 [Patulibacter sp.]|nr:glycosyl transferase family 28 [Patulibacter sp.]